MLTLLELQKEVEQKYTNICLALQSLKLQQKLLAENAEKIMNNIKLETDAHVNLLKGKEKQLLRQVEFVTAHQKSLLDTQIANSLLVQGSLSTFQDVLSKYIPEEEETLLKIKDHLQNKITLPTVASLKMISVELETNPLCTAIENFGVAHLPDSVMHHHSSVVPAKIEDYGDSEEVVLHKSLGLYQKSPEDSTLSVTVKFPKIPNHSSWLLGNQDKNVGQLKYMSGDKQLDGWLSSVSRPTPSSRGSSPNAMDEDEDMDDGFHFVEFENRSSGENMKEGNSCGSSSIEIVGSEKDCGTSCCSNTCSPPVKCQANECLFDGSYQTLEVEKALQTSKWLRKSNFEKVESVLPTPMDSLNNLSRFLHSPGQKRKVALAEGQGMVLTHMAEILASDPKKWLVRPSNELARPAISNKMLYKVPADVSWFSQHPESVPAADPIKSGFRPPALPIWLLRQWKEKGCIEDNRKEEKDMKNTENKQNFVADLNEALDEIAGFKALTSKKSLLSRNVTPKLQEMDADKKLEWLLRTSSPGQSIVWPKYLHSCHGNNRETWLLG